MTCATSRRRAEAGEAIQLGVSVVVPASTAAPLVMRFALVNDKGEVVKAGRQEVAQPPAGDDYWLNFGVPVDPAHYNLRVAIADHEGHIGAVEEPVVAELTRLGPFFASDLLTTWTGSDGPPRFLALASLPKAAKRLGVSLELYPQQAIATDSVKVRLALVPDGAVDPLAERELIPTQHGGSLIVTADLPVEALDPGAYTLRAIVLDSDTTVGSVSKPIRKAEPSAARTTMFFAPSGRATGLENSPASVPHYRVPSTRSVGLPGGPGS